MAFLDAHELGAGDVEVQPVGEGHSNVTYALRRDGANVVLRRPPRGPLPPSAHDVLREARVLSALAGRARVPAVLAVCDDESVIGAPVLRHGARRGPRRHELACRPRSTAPTTAGGSARSSSTRSSRSTPSTGATPAWRASASRPATSSASCAASSACGSTTARATSRPSSRWANGSRRTCPTSARPATVVHGDYRLGNTMMAPDAPARLVAVFDWEMADHRRSAGRPRLPLHAVGRPQRPDGGHVRAVGRHPRGGLPAARGARRPLRGALGALDDRHPLVPARWPCGSRSCSWRATTSARCPGATDDPYLKGFGEGVIQLAAARGGAGPWRLSAAPSCSTGAA